MTETPGSPPRESETRLALRQLFADEEAERLALQRIFILVMALSITGIFIWMVRDFLGAVFLAAVLAIFLMPVQNLLTRAMGGRPRIAASITLTLALLILMIPMPILLAIIGEQALQLADTLGPWLRDQVQNVRDNGVDALPEWVPFRESLAPFQAEITQQAGELAAAAGGVVMGLAARVTGSTMMIFLNVIIFLFALFFFLLSGPKIARQGLHLMPLPQQDRNLLAERALSTIRATVKGTLVIGVIQGSVTGVSLAIAGVPGGAFWGLVAGLVSIIPGIGTVLVWGPAAAWLFFNGDVVPAIALSLWGFIVIMNIDNVLRPYLVGRDAKLNDLMVLISTLGGIVLFGAVGLILGPVIAALMSSIWYLYARSYAVLLNEGPTFMASAAASTAPVAPEPVPGEDKPG